MLQNIDRLIGKIAMRNLLTSIITVDCMSAKFQQIAKGTW
jgi:altronate dehydratase